MPGAERRGNRELLFNGVRSSVWKDEKVLKMGGSGGGKLHNEVNVLNATKVHS